MFVEEIRRAVQACQRGRLPELSAAVWKYPRTMPAPSRRDRGKEGGLVSWNDTPQNRLPAAVTG